MKRTASPAPRALFLALTDLTITYDAGVPGPDPWLNQP